MKPEMLAGFVFSLTVTALGVILLKVVRGIENKRDLQHGNPMRNAVSIFGGTLVGCGAFASWCFLSAALGSNSETVSFRGIIGFPGIVPLIVLAEILIRRRRAQQQALLWVLASAAERLIPLVSAVEAFARDERGLFGYRAKHLARLLRDGVSLPVAMRRSGTLFPAEIKPILHAGQESGAVAAALRHAASRHDAYRQVLGELAGKLAYLGLIIFVAINILTFMMLRLVPSFEMIFGDFETGLPALTQSLIDISSWFGQYWFLFTPIGPVFWAVVGYAMLRYHGWIHWDPPVIDRWGRRLDSAVILDSLALAAERRTPLHATLAVLADTYHKADIRSRLRNTVCDIDAGADWCGSLATRGLITPADRAVLQAAQGAGNLSWALHEMADSNRRRLALRLQGWVQVAFPPIVLAIGAFTAFVVVALFLPLLSLIWKLT